MSEKIEQLALPSGYDSQPTAAVVDFEFSMPISIIASEILNREVNIVMALP